MAYIHCSCGAECDAPTDVEVIKDEYYCPRCDKHLDPRKSHLDVLLSLLERVEELEKKAFPPHVPAQGPG